MLRAASSTRPIQVVEVRRVAPGMRQKQKRTLFERLHLLHTVRTADEYESGLEINLVPLLVRKMFYV